MGYTLPRCTCGGALVYIQSFTTATDRYREINKDGHPSSRFKDDVWPQEVDLESLRCKECGNQFKVTRDEKGRIVCGEIFV